MERFDESLRWTKIALLFSGVKTSKPNFSPSIAYFLNRYIYYFNISWLYLDIYAEINWVIAGIIKELSFIYLSMTAPCITITVLGTIKTTFLYFNNDIVNKIMDKLRDMHPETNEDFEGNPKKNDAIISEDAESAYEADDYGVIAVDAANSVALQREIVEKSEKFLQFMVRLLYYLSAALLFSFSLMPVTSMAYDYCKTGVVEMKYPFMVKYFFEAFRWSVWPVIYFHHVVSAAIVYVNMVGPDTFMYAACIYVQMHFRLLCHRLENIVSASAEQTRRDLKDAVRRHQELIELVEQVELLYSKSLLFNIVTSSILICLSGFIITVLNEFYILVIYSAFLVLSLSQIALICFFGDMLMRSSTEVSLAVYKSLWYETDKSTKKIMLLIHMRTQKPCKLTAHNFADLNLNAFTTILSRSWSYFALLRTMYK